MDTRVLTKHISGAAFSFYSAEEVRALSVKRITNALSFDQLKQPVPSGLYDPSLGPVDKFGSCPTCGLTQAECPGHFGHIDLNVTVYNPILFETMFKLLRLKCFNCHKLRAPESAVRNITLKLALLDAGLLLEFLELSELMSRPVVRAGKEKDDASAEDGLGALNMADVIEKKRKEIERKLAKTVSSSKNLSGRDVTHMANFRREVIREFMSLKGSGRCAHCSSHTPSLRKDAASKIFLLPLTEKAEKAMHMMGKTVANVLDSDGALANQAEEEAALLSAKLAKQKKKHALKQQLKAKAKKSGKMRRAGRSSDDEGSGSELDQDDSSSESDNEVEMSSDSDSDDAESGIAVDKTAKFPKLKGKAAKDAEMEQEIDMIAKKVATRLLFPNEVERHFELLWQEENRVLSSIFNASADSSLCPKGVHLRQHDWRIFFLRVLAVPPSRFRPPVILHDLTFEHAQNHYYKKIIEANLRIAQYSAEDENADPAKRKSDLARVTNSWIELQEAVNCLMDSSKNTNAATAKTAPSGIRQELERKEGLFRMHMMGKRVNFAARSVISPDPYLHTSEIGIPERFAKKLTYPQPVNAWNVHEMRQAVVNGPDVYPGANFVQDEHGKLVNLEALSQDQRVALSKTLLMSSLSTSKAQASAGVAGRGGAKIVLRHLKNGDVLLANRQPTLHKPSMMAHKARVLQGQQTIRMHYANCKTYNADFDGDEINLHFPQNELARAELYNIANTDNQYIVPTNGKPIRGLIQDHVVSGVLLTARDQFFTRAEFQQLMFSACTDANPRVPIKMPPPAIMRPRMLWTGKQLFSAVLAFVCNNLPPLTMDSSASVPADAWFKGSEENQVIIIQNDLLVGVVDKNQYGASAFGVVHAAYELFGAGIAGNLLSALGRLFTAFLQQMRGFTCGMDDLVITAEADKGRQEAIRKSDEEGVRAAAKFAEIDLTQFNLDKPEQLELAKRAVSTGLRGKLRQPANAANLDSVMRGALSPTTTKIIQKCLPSGQIKPFPWNCMSAMTLSGAKGSLVNFSQISCLLGQQELEGRRVPVMASGKSLPSFAAFDPSPRAGGYVTQRFLSGILPQEFYFHCMAGREGLVDTAVKTARSGYLQRCLIKHLESLKVNYDYTVRDCDGSVVQFHYGEDSLDVTRSKYLEKFSFFAKNYKALLHKLNPAAAISALDTQSVSNYREETKGQKADPVLSKFVPTANLGAISEKFQSQINKYISANPEKLLSTSSSSSSTSSKVTSDKFQTLMQLNYMRSVVDPGEAVGCIAGQSVGEPSTQMTLNTFHLAGHGGRNVTLGIPRLREIIMTASDHISTPSMELKLLSAGDKDTAEFISRKLSRLRLGELIDFISVKESIQNEHTDPNSRKVRSYRLRLNLLPLTDPSFVVFKHAVGFKEVVNAIEHSFAPKLMSFVTKEQKKVTVSGAAEGAAGVIQSQRATRMGTSQSTSKDDDEDVSAVEADDSRRKKKGGKSAVSGGARDDDVEEEDPEADDAEDGDGDATETSLRNKKREGQDYDDADEEDRDAMHRAGQLAEDESDSDSSDSLDNDEDEDGAAMVKVAAMDDDDDDAPLAKKSSSKAAAPASSSKSSKKSSSSALVAFDYDAVVDRMLEANRYLSEVVFDTEHEHFVELTLQVPIQSKKMLLVSAAESICKNVFVRSIKGIEKCFLETKDTAAGKEFSINTDGVNFSAAWQLGDQIDVNKIESNDIAAILRTYGVEAARASIVNQVSAVFNAYGIGVDFRHLSLIADYMTFEGGYRPLNRMGMESSTSPWLKMTFETSMHFLSAAAEFGEVDHMQSPAARLVVGKPVGSGTGSFDLMYPLVPPPAQDS